MKVILAVGIVIIKDNQAILVRHKKAADHLDRAITLPSGKVDKFEEPKEAAIREAFEEAGVTIKSKDLIRLPSSYVADIQMKSGLNRYIWLTYYTTKFTGEIKGLYETEPFWIDIDKLDTIKYLPNVDKAVHEAKSLI